MEAQRFKYDLIRGILFNEFNFELQEKLNRLKILIEKSSFFNFSINSLTLYNKLFGDKIDIHGGGVGGPQIPADEGIPQGNNVVEALCGGGVLAGCHSLEHLAGVHGGAGAHAV